MRFKEEIVNKILELTHPRDTGAIYSKILTAS